MDADRHRLLLRLVGRCSLESLAQICAELGLPHASVGYLSQRLTAYAQALPKELPTGAQIVLLLVASTQPEDIAQYYTTQGR